MTFISKAIAITAPEAGTLGYDLYDVFVLQGLHGALGFIGGIAGILYSGAHLAAGNWKLPVLGVLGSSMLVRADKVTETLGMLI